MELFWCDTVLAVPKTKKSRLKKQRLPVTEASYLFVCAVLACAIGAVALMNGGTQLLVRFSYELTGPLTWDSTMYLAVGRGILNGLLPYQDLFETKPPGMFVLSTIALLVTKDASFTGVLQLFALLLPLLGLLAYAYFHAKEGTKIIGVLCAALLGTAFTLYVAERSGEFQTESFGVAAGVLYVLAISWGQWKVSPWRIGLATLGILFAVGLKEPFLLSLLAVGLFLNCTTPKRLVWDFVAPLLLAMLTGAILLLLWGIFSSYINVYLPAMHGYVGSALEPWERGLNVRAIWRDVAAFRPALPFLVLGVLIGAVFAKFSLLPKKVFPLLSSSILVILSFYLLSVAVGFGGQYYNHHYAFAVPGYFAFAAALLKMEAVRARLVVLSALLLLASAVFFTPEHESLSRRQHNFLQDKERTVAAAQIIDAVLDRCNEDRYLFLGFNGMQPYAYTLHSPFGPSFVQNEFILGTRQTSFRQSFQENLRRANVVVLERLNISNLQAWVEQELRTNFTEQAPACAAGATVSPPYRLMFRRDFARPIR